MKHTVLGTTKIRVGVIKGFFCYQPFQSGRLGKAVALFPDRGSMEANDNYLWAYFESYVKENGDIFVTAKGR
jgi:hypothetical protein